MAVATNARLTTMRQLDLSSSETSVQVRVLREGKHGPILRTRSLKHGFDFTGLNIVQVMRSLLCPSYLNCKWCESVVEKAKSNTDGNPLGIFY